MYIYLGQPKKGSFSDPIHCHGRLWLECSNGGDENNRRTFLQVRSCLLLNNQVASILAYFSKKLCIWKCGDDKNELNYSRLVNQIFLQHFTFRRSIEALTFISHSLSSTDSWVCNMGSTDGLAAAFDTTTSILPYFCK